MNFQMNDSALRKTAMLLLLMAVPALALAQHKTSSAPAKPSAPAHSSAPAQHASAPSHNTGSAAHPGGSNAGRPGGTTGGHPGTSTAGHTGTSTAGRPGSSTGGRPGTSTAGHTGTSTAGHGGNATAGHAGPGGAAAGKGGAAGHGGTATAGRGGAGGAHTNMSHAAPGRQVSLKGGGSAHIRPNGQIRSVNRNGMHIEHGMHGGRTVVSTRNGVRVVSVGHRGGYVQRAYVVRGGHSYYSRTYYYHGGYRAGVYRGYYYGGRPYYGYYPAYYYHPVYYGWAYNPWPAPVAYGWGWGGAPWYGYYGAYYAPYPVYPSAYFWLTDFMIAATLQAAYQAQADANALLSPYDHDDALVASLMPLAAPDAKPAMTEEVKKALSEEVKITLAAEKAEAEKPKSSSAGGSQPAQSNEAPPALDPNFKTFIVSSDMSLETDGDECALAQGDVVQRTGDKPDDDGNVTVKVVASNKSDCAIGKEGPVSTDDLQEMYNSFRESLKDGMGELAKKNGTGGLPKAPDTTTSDGDVPAPPPDKSAEKTLQDQATAADQTESEVKQEAGSGGGGSQ
jgi:hypothetical protein